MRLKYIPPRDESPTTSVRSCEPPLCEAIPFVIPLAAPNPEPALTLPDKPSDDGASQGEQLFRCFLILVIAGLLLICFVTFILCDIKQDIQQQTRTQPNTTAETAPGKVVESSFTGMKLVYIPPGKFRMGSPAAEKGRFESEGPQHEVTFSKGFYLGKYEVTQQEYEKVMGNNPSTFKGAKLPVEMVSWEEAKEFCKKLSAKEGKEYRLPTEAEWEYACRAGTTTPFHTGAQLTTDQANYDGNYPSADGVKGTCREKTVAVGSFAPNAFGLHDMHGNVWEWCADWYNEKEYQRGDCVDPTGPATGEIRVIRGGCWYYTAGYGRSAYRNTRDPSYRNYNLGFRLCLGSVVK